MQKLIVIRTKKDEIKLNKLLLKGFKVIYVNSCNRITDFGEIVQINEYILEK